MISFTHHNIRLDDGTFTKPEIGFLTSEFAWFLAAKRAIEVTFQDGMAGKRIVDLGCLEGGYTVEFARMGFDALGIEVRKNNFAACEYVRAHLALPNLHFARDDVWNIEKYGKFDAIFCSGLLYHLDRPIEFLKMISRLCRRLIILNTHVARETTNPNFSLGEMTEHEGVPGRWLHEFDPTSPDLDQEEIRWSSWGNPQSFWPRQEYIVDALRQGGFDMVFEQFDFLGDNLSYDMTRGYYAAHDRRMLVGIKSR
jgi:SAM-dependent methyltransferase